MSSYFCESPHQSPPITTDEVRGQSPTLHLQTLAAWEDPGAGSAISVLKHGWKIQHVLRIFIYIYMWLVGMLYSIHSMIDELYICICLYIYVYILSIYFCLSLWAGLWLEGEPGVARRHRQMTDVLWDGQWMCKLKRLKHLFTIFSSNYVRTSIYSIHRSIRCWISWGLSWSIAMVCRPEAHLFWHDISLKMSLGVVWKCWQNISENHENHRKPIP